MREILFRGKRKDNGEWVYGDLVHWWGRHNTKPDIQIYNNVQRFNVIPESVSEFTGLTDKNGKKIFEGDIVDIKDFTHGCALNYKQPTSKWVVHWREDTARFCIDYMSLLPFDFTKSEIIGNIHDNAELLEAEQ